MGEDIVWCREGESELDGLVRLLAAEDCVARAEVREAGERALLYESEGAWEAAAGEFLRVVEAAPRSLAAYRFAAISLVGIERCGEALEVADEAVQLNPSDAEAYLVLGEVADAAGAYALAGMAYQEALERGQEGARLPLANALHRLRRHGEAAAAFGGAHRLRGSEDCLHYGLSLLALGNAVEAITHLRRAAALDPESADAQAALGLACALEGRHAEAVDALSRCAELGGPFRYALREAPGRAYAMLEAR